MSTVSHLDRFLVEPVSKAFTTDFARKLVNLRADDDPELKAKIEELRRKADEGTLTPEEDAEYKDYAEALDVLSILQLRARRFLSQNMT